MRCRAPDPLAGFARGTATQRRLVRDAFRLVARQSADALPRRTSTAVDVCRVEQPTQPPQRLLLVHHPTPASPINAADNTRRARCNRLRTVPTGTPCTCATS